MNNPSVSPEAEAKFLRATIHSLNSSISVTTLAGDIVFVNSAWQAFGEQNAGCASTIAGVGMNYFESCEKAARGGDAHARRAVRAIKLVATGASKLEYLEYPCHSPTKKRWFTMRVTRFEVDGAPYVSIMHIDVTTRKLAEIRTRELAVKDPLTDLFNRRAFDEELQSLLHKADEIDCLTLALIDIDHFKQVNDSYGHSYGDECLQKVAAILKEAFSAESCFVARYGGEEFAVIMVGLSPREAVGLMEAFVAKLAGAGIEHKGATTGDVLTVSAGLVTTVDYEQLALDRLMDIADEKLYEAKDGGRNQLRHTIMPSS